MSAISRLCSLLPRQYRAAISLFAIAIGGPAHALSFESNALEVCYGVPGKEAIASDPMSTAVKTIVASGDLSDVPTVLSAFQNLSGTESDYNHTRRWSEGNILAGDPGNVTYLRNDAAMKREWSARLVISMKRDRSPDQPHLETGSSIKFCPLMLSLLPFLEIDDYFIKPYNDGGPFALRIVAHSAKKLHRKEPTLLLIDWNPNDQSVLDIIIEQGTA